MEIDLEVKLIFWLAGITIEYLFDLWMHSVQLRMHYWLLESTERHFTFECEDIEIETGLMVNSNRARNDSLGRDELETFGFIDLIFDW